MVYVPVWRQQQLAHMAALQAAAKTSAHLVLYGATAINMYLDPIFWIDTKDLDFFCTADTLDDFYVAVQAFETALATALLELPVLESEWDVRVNVRHSAYIHGRPTTVKMYVGNLHVADVSMHSVDQVRSVERQFPREVARVLTSCFAPFNLQVASLNELLHRMASTIANRPCVDGFFIDALSSDDATHLAQQQRVLKDSLRLDRLMLVHGMNQNLLVWKPRVFKVHDSFAAAHDQLHTLRTPIGTQSKLAFPDVAAIEAAFTYIPQAKAKAIMHANDDARETLNLMRRDLNEARDAFKDQLLTCTASTSLKCMRAVAETESAQRKIVMDLRQDLFAAKQREETVQRKLERANAKHADKINDLLKKAAEREKQLTAKYDKELSKLKMKTRELTDECNAKTRVIEDRGKAITAHKGYFEYLQDITKKNFEVMINAQKSCMGAWHAVLLCSGCFESTLLRRRDDAGRS